MKVNELRLGIIVSIDNPKCWPEMRDVPVVVTGISERPDIKNMGGFSISLKGQDSEFAQAIDLIKPIPLTEEILTKWCGFEHFKSNNGPHVWELDGFDFFLCRHGDIWVLGCYSDEVCSSILYFAHGNLQFLHQLQNLYFALTGEELEVNNQ